MNYTGEKFITGPDELWKRIISSGYEYLGVAELPPKVFVETANGFKEVSHAALIQMDSRIVAIGMAVAEEL